MDKEMKTINHKIQHFLNRKYFMYSQLCAINVPAMFKNLIDSDEVTLKRHTIADI